GRLDAAVDRALAPGLAVERHRRLAEADDAAEAVRDLDATRCAVADGAVVGAERRVSAAEELVTGVVRAGVAVAAVLRAGRALTADAVDDDARVERGVAVGEDLARLRGGAAHDDERDRGHPWHERPECGAHQPTLERRRHSAVAPGS